MTQTTATDRFWTRKVSAVLAAALLVSTLTTACDGDQKSVEEHLTRAENLRKAGDLKGSLIEAKNALQADPAKQDARFILGLDYLDLGAWSAAETTLERVMKSKGILEFAAIPPLARAKIALSKYDEVLKIAQVQEGMKSGLVADVLVVRGQALTAIGKKDEAKKSFEQAIQSDPASFGAYVGLATLAAANDDKKARAMLAKASDIAPDSVDVLLFRGYLEFHDKNFEASRRAFQKLVKVRPERPDFYLGLARAEIALGEYKQAIKALKYPLKVAPKNPPTNYYRALAAYRTKDYQNALSYAEAVLNLSPGDTRAQLIAGSAAFALGRYEIALDKLKKVVDKVPDLKAARELLGIVQIRLGQPKAAYSTLSAFADKDGTSASMLALLGKSALLTRNMKAGTDYLERALALDPDNSRARALLATALVERGELDKGIDELKTAVSKDPKIPNAEVVLIVSLIKAKRYDEALKAVKEFQKRFPDSAIGYTLEAGVQLGRKDLEKARAALKKALEIEPGRPDAGTNLAVLAIRQSEPDKASEYLREILKHHPANARALGLLWQLENQRGRAAQIEPLLEKAIQADSKSAVARTLLGRILLKTNRPRKALSVVLPGLQTAPDDAGLLDTAGRADYDLKDYAAAISMFRRVLDQRPKSANTYFLLGLSYQHDGQVEPAKKALEKVIELNGRHANARFVLTRLYIRDREFDAAARQIAALKTQFKNSSAIAFLEAQLLQAQGKHKQAADIYAHMPGPPSSDITRRLAQAQWLSGQKSAAIKTLRGWLEKHPQDRLIKVFLGSYLASMNRLPEATSLLRELVKSNPNSWLVQNEIAWTLYEAGDANKALPYAQRARELAPGSPEVADTMAVILLEIGNLPQALVLLREAAQKLPDDPNVHLHLARALIKNNLPDEARRVLTSLLATKKEFGGRHEAAALLKKLKDGT